MDFSSTLDPNSLHMISKIKQKNQEIVICEDSNGKYVLKSLNSEEYHIFKKYSDRIQPFANHFEYSSKDNGMHLIYILI